MNEVGHLKKPSRITLGSTGLTSVGWNEARRNPTLDVIVRLTHGLDTTASDLLSTVEQESGPP